MRIGVFDSGMGGLVILKSLRARLPDYEYVYLGDTLHVPYGGRSAEAIYDFSRVAVDALFREQDCALIIMACNTASAAALRRIQQEYLPRNFPDRRVLGVVVPTLEATSARGYSRIGVLATRFVVQSHVYKQELQKINPSMDILEQAAPLLVPMIENQGLEWVDPILEHYLQPFTGQGIEALILGCTHYPILKDRIARILGGGVDIISQDDIIPERVEDYLRRHADMEKRLGRGGTCAFFATDTTPALVDYTCAIMGAPVTLHHLTGT